MEVSAELLGQSDDDALRATQEAEPVDVLVLRDLADEFGTVAAQAGNDVVELPFPAVSPALLPFSTPTVSMRR